MAKTEQKACLSTSSPDITKSLPRQKAAHPTPPRRAQLQSADKLPARLDHVLFTCYILVYLELGWLILLLLRTFSCH